MTGLMAAQLASGQILLVGWILVQRNAIGVALLEMHNTC